MSAPNLPPLPEKSSQTFGAHSSNSGSSKNAADSYHDLLKATGGTSIADREPPAPAPLGGPFGQTSAWIPKAFQPRPKTGPGVTQRMRSLCCAAPNSATKEKTSASSSPSTSRRAGLNEDARTDRSGSGGRRAGPNGGGR